MQDSVSFVAAQTEPSHGITIKSTGELECMREAGRVVAQVIQSLREAVVPGVSTNRLDVLASREIKRMGAKPAFKGYRGFPATICVSVNNEIVHGIPGDRTIKDGDIVSMDVGAIVGGVYGDSATTVAVGDIPEELQVLLETTEEALHVGIRAALAGARVGDIGAAIQGYVESKGDFGLVREYVGHGIGRNLHEEPSVPNFGHPGLGPLLQPGMAIAIEPMVNLGGWRTRMLEDGWTVVTADGSPSAHFEHTIAITDGVPEILTAL